MCVSPALHVLPTKIVSELSCLKYLLSEASVVKIEVSCPAPALSVLRTIAAGSSLSNIIVPFVILFPSIPAAIAALSTLKLLNFEPLIPAANFASVTDPSATLISI